MLGQVVEVELRFDGALAVWQRIAGRVSRIDAAGVAIVFDAPTSPLLLRVIDELTTASHASARVSLGYLSEVERGRKEPSSELLNAICDALEVPLSEVLTDAGERMARQERAAGAGTGGGTIDASTKVVIPQVTSLAVA